jgi:molybdopterin-synthase adenylyltransferase
MSNLDFTEEEMQRYARHITLPQVGGIGQRKLMNSKVLVIGAGGLGSPLLLYLAAAGIGTIGIIDDDKVELSNLQRQIIHKTDNINIYKTDSAKETILAINPNIKVITYKERFTVENAENIVSEFDIIADGSDNFGTRFLANDTCYFKKKTLVSAAILRFEGQISTYSAYKNSKCCYRCLWPSPPPKGLIASCGEAGVFGALAGSIGSIQGIEVLKEILGIGHSLNNHLLIFDTLSSEMRKVKIKKDNNCQLCGLKPTITSIKKHKDYS